MSTLVEFTFDDIRVGDVIKIVDLKLGVIETNEVAFKTADAVAMERYSVHPGNVYSKEKLESRSVMITLIHRASTH